MRALLSCSSVAPRAARRSSRPPRAPLPRAPPACAAALRRCRVQRRRCPAPPRALTQPEQLVSVPAEGDAGATTLTLRVTTGSRREDELSEPDAALLVTLIAADGRAVLHRECSGSGGSGYARGERGGSDSLHVRVPAGFGRPAAVWLAPERGTWRVESAEVSCGASEEAPAWSCRYLAATAYDAATELRPADDAAAFPRRTPEETEAARVRSMEAYDALKARLLGVTAALSAPGTALAARLGGAAAAIAFAAGAAGGVAYLLSLQRGVDALGPSKNDGKEGQGASTAGDASSALGGAGGAARLAAVAAAAVLGAKSLADGGASVAELRVELAAGVAGFLTYKLAVLIVGLLFPQDDGAEPPAAS